MKKNKFPWRKIYAVVIFVALVVTIALLYLRITEISNQMAYLQDTNNVILSEVDNLQSSFKQTLEEENSMIESYSIDVADMDFAVGTYEAAVSVIPKEYTDETKVSIFFGTKECALELSGYTYAGSVTLPLDKTYDGNLTILLANGKKKSTEVVSDYEGLYNHLDQVLSGSLAEEPEYSDGVLSLDSDMSCTLDGVELYEFDSLDMVFELDGEEVGTIDILTWPSADEVVEDSAGDTEEASDVSQIELPVSGTSGNYPIEFSYDLKEELSEDEEAPEDPEIRVYLRALSTEGYRFECTLFGGDERVVYDKKGGSYEINE
jgi:hypothetical protein